MAGTGNGKAISVWESRIMVKNAIKVEYAIGCQTDRGDLWDNNWGTNYVSRRAGLKILTLNLHCYQEAEQLKKFREIAKAIQELDIDIVCLQEVCERWNNGEGDWPSNAAKIIRDHLRGRGRDYHLHTDWSHIGFGCYREGSAILSKYRFLKKDAAYVSTNCDIHNIHSRKVVMTQLNLPCFGLLNVYSVHLSWWEDGFVPQFENLWKWAKDNAVNDCAQTLLCGDFNITAGSRAYMMIADNKGYEDQFLRSASPDIFAKIFRESTPERERLLDGDDRIDFMFARKNSTLTPTSSRVLFTGKEYQRVSDHLGYLTEFEPVQPPGRRKAALANLPSLLPADLSGQ
jgi:maltose 6'-phosphate phosphatase